MEAGDSATARGAILLASLPNELAETILQRATTRTYHRGETIFLQGDPADFIFVVLDGWMKLFRITPTGSEAVVGVFTKGRSFGEAVAFAGGTYPVSAEAVTEGRLLLVRAGILSSMMKDRPEIATAILSSAFRHLQGLVSQLEQLKAHTGAQRVAEFLLELCNSETGSCTITLPYDKTLIAGRLGMQPQSLSRAFNRLEPLGVRIAHNQASIADVDKLREYMLEDRSAPWRKSE
ncbi:MAG: Crp/Fnr family transcriptional regulator [Alphaproteobacteria bacterium]|nr:Crp/Fnr family transcriptional regulator [Alphaproteobacteria bacterium]